MRQLTFIRPKKLAWWDVPEPSLGGPEEALVRPFVAARCDGDSLFLRHDFERSLRLGAALHVVDPSFRSKESDIFAGPFAYGHEGVAEVVAVGDAVRGVVVGDVVVIPWSISCGTCGCCGSGLTSHCERASPPVGAYGFGKAVGEWGGMVSDLVRVPYADAMLVKVPSSVDPLALASAGDNMCDGYRAVAPGLAKQPGAPVLIVGGAAKSVGLYAAGIAVALGASRVDYIDSSEVRLRMAERLGANSIELTRGARWLGVNRSLQREGYPITVDATGTTVGLTHAITSLAPGGSCTAVGFYLRKGTPLPLWHMYMKSASLHVGISHPRVSLPSVLGLIESGAFDPRIVTPLVGAWADADRILLEPATKVVVQRARRSGQASAAA